MATSSPGSRSRGWRWARRSHFVPGAGQVLRTPSWAGSSHLGLALLATSWPHGVPCRVPCHGADGCLLCSAPLQSLWRKHVPVVTEAPSQTSVAPLLPKHPVSGKAIDVLKRQRCVVPNCSFFFFFFNLKETQTASSCPPPPSTPGGKKKKEK